MSPLGRLLGPLFPACGTDGAEGIPPPPPLDPARLARPATPNNALAAPAGAGERPDVTTPRYPVPAPLLWAAVQGVAERQKRTYPLALDPQHMQGSWVARSLVWNFPDVVSTRVWADGPDGGMLALYARSLYGHSDLGVNRRRLNTWLAALNETLQCER